MNAENQISRRDLVANLGQASPAQRLRLLFPQRKLRHRTVLRSRLLLTRHQSVPSRHIQANRNLGQASPVR
jgi:hypothetical protein